jgi:ferrochelatase
MIAVLLMAYGTPRSLDEVEAYYTHIRGGRRPSPELIEGLVARYRAIGGLSPLLDITRRQAAALEAALNGAQGKSFRVYVGMKHAPPFIADAVSDMASDGLSRGLAMALAPHYSRMSIGGYINTVKKALGELPSPLPMAFVESWHDHPTFLGAVAEGLQEALGRLSQAERAAVHVIFTAHSLPARILEWDDPYPRELRRTCEGVARLVGLQRWDFAYQSAGHTPDPWLGPDVKEVLERLAAEGKRPVVICPVGFVADHLEVLYDIDVECQALAASLGMRLERTPSPNDRPRFIAALAEVVRAHLRTAGDP